MAVVAEEDRVNHGMPRTKDWTGQSMLSLGWAVIAADASVGVNQRGLGVMDVSEFLLTVIGIGENRNTVIMTLICYLLQFFVARRSGTF